MPVGCAGVVSAIMTLSPCLRNRLAERIKKLPVESMMVPLGSSLCSPLPPAIRMTLARASCAGLSRRTTGVLTMNVVSMVTASASGPPARAADDMIAAAPPASAHARKNADKRGVILSRRDEWSDMSLSCKSCKIDSDLRVVAETCDPKMPPRGRGQDGASTNNHPP